MRPHEAPPLAMELHRAHLARQARSISAPRREAPTVRLSESLFPRTAVPRVIKRVKVYRPRATVPVNDFIAPPGSKEIRITQAHVEQWRAASSAIVVTPVQEIIEMVAHNAGLQTADLMKRDQHNAVAIPRQFAMWLIYTVRSDRGMPSIADAFGMDSSTVHYSVHKISKWIKSGKLHVPEWASDLIANADRARNEAGA